MVNVNLNWAEETNRKIEEKMERVCRELAGTMPAVCAGSRYDDRRAAAFADTEHGISWWTNGFFGGVLWQMYYRTGRQEYAGWARNLEEQLDECLADYYGLHHDVGFMWQPTAVADYCLTGNRQSRRRALHAADLLAGRFNPAGFIRAWNDNPVNDVKGWAIIDSMMNLSLLYWAYAETGDYRYRNIADRHTETVRQNFIRTDGSICHIVEFDPVTGARVRSHGGQGYAHGSAWSRGQAWAIYGFAIGYRHTRDRRSLETAKKAADYFIAGLPDDYLVPVDFKQPLQPWKMDDTAAAIAACGLLELAEAEAVGDEVKDQQLYAETAGRLLEALAKAHCDWSCKRQAVLTHCTSSYHAKSFHQGFMYADYFFMEAMGRLQDKSYFLW